MNLKNELVTAVVVGIVGILLIIFEGRGDLLSWIAVVIGIMFIIPSAYLLFGELSGRRGSHNSSSLIAALGGLGLGVCLCVVPGFFVGIFIYMFAILLILGGLYQIIVITRAGGMPGAFYVVPALLIVAGVVMLCAGIERDSSAIVLIAGIGMVLYSVNSILEYRSMQKLLKQ